MTRIKKTCYAVLWDGMACGWDFYYEEHSDGTDHCPSCDNHVPGNQLVLHPDRLLRDPYGIITQNQIHEYARMAEAFVDGWTWSWEESDQKIGRRPEYNVLREYVGCIADIPFDIVCQIALHYCNPSRDMFIDRPFYTGPFHAIP